jgi:hypothetical protein
MKVQALPLLAAAVALLLWGVSKTGGGDPVPTLMTGPAPSPRVRGSEGLNRPEPALITPERVTHGGPTLAPASTPHSGEGTLAVTLLAGESQEPLVDARLVVYDPSGPTGTQVTAGRWSQTTHANGQASFTLPTGRPLRLAVRAASVGMENSSVELPPFSAGEQRTLTIQLERMQKGALEGILLDASTDAPIAGAEVRLFSRRGSRAMTHLLGHSGRPDAWSDEEGRFELQGPAGEASFAGVYAIGYGPMFFDLDGKPGLADSTSPIRLQRSAAYELNVGQARSSSEMHLTLTTAGKRVQEGGPSPLLAGPLTWSAKVNQEGVAQVLGMPPHVALNVQVWKGATQIYASSSPITLAASERRVLRLDAGSTTMITGVMRNEAGKPASHREVWLVPAEYRAPGLLNMANAKKHKPLRSITDAGGRYRFLDPEPGDWWVGPAPDADPAPGSKPVLPAARWIHLPEGPLRVELDLTLHTGVYLEGVVQDADGNPVPNACFRFRAAREAGVDQQQTDERGRFSAGPLLPGLYDVWIAPGAEGEHRGSLPRTVRAGSGPVQFTVHRGSWILVRAIAPGVGREARITRGLLTKLTPSPSLARDLRTSLLAIPAPESRLSLPRDAELRGGTMELHGLEAGPYAVALYTADGRVAVLERLEAKGTEGPAQAHAVLKPVGWLLLEHLGDAHTAHYQILRGDVIVGSGALGCGALAEIPVPLGKLRVEWAIQGQPVRSKVISSESQGRVRVHF